jgi:hypothetical protein
MDREVLVSVDLDGAPYLAGRLWTRLRKNKETATFEYDADWLQHPARFSLETRPATRTRSFSHSRGHADVRRHWRLGT